MHCIITLISPRTLTKSRPKTNKINGSTVSLSNTLRFRKKENRRMNSDSSNSVHESNSNTSQTQWYTKFNDTQNSMTNLSNTPDTMVDSFDTFPEFGFNSRPSSGHYNHRASIQSHLSVLHYNSSMSSLAISLLSPNEDNEMPPPLPAKQSLTSEPIPALPLKSKKLSNDNRIYQPYKRPEPNGI